MSNSMMDSILPYPLLTHRQPRRVKKSLIKNISFLTKLNKNVSKIYLQVLKVAYSFFSQLFD